MGEKSRSTDAIDPVRKRLGAGTGSAAEAIRKFEKLRSGMGTPPASPASGLPTSKFIEDFKRRMARPRPDPLGNAFPSTRKVLSSALGGGKAIR